MLDRYQRFEAVDPFRSLVSPPTVVVMVASVLLAFALAGTDPPARPASPAPIASAPPGDRAAAFAAGHGALGGGIGLAALSTSAFLVGFDSERELRRTPHDRAIVDVLLLRRAVAGAVAWSTATLAVAAIAGGGIVLALDDALPDTEVP